MKLKRYNEFVNESKSINSADESINEGWKEYLSVALMLLTQYGYSKGDGKPTLTQQVKSEETIKKAAQALSDKKNISFEDALEITTKASDEFSEKGADRIVKKSMTLSDARSASKVLVELKNGYAVTKVTADTIFTHIPEQEFEAKTNMESVTVPGDNYFESGTFTIKQEAKDYLQKAVDGVLSNNGVLLRITIGSSTDKQRVSESLQSVLTEMGYDADNEGLSQARNDAMSEYLESIGLSDVSIVQDVKSNQGSGEQDSETPQDASARYVNVHIFFTNIETEPEPAQSIENMTIYYIFELSKPIKIEKPNTPPDLKSKSYKGKCPKPHKVSQHPPEGSVLGTTRR